MCVRLVWLGGWQVYTHNPLCDVNAFAPRVRLALHRGHILYIHMRYENHRPLCEVERSLLLALKDCANAVCRTMCVRRA